MSTSCANRFFTSSRPPEEVAERAAQALRHSASEPVGWPVERPASGRSPPDPDLASPETRWVVEPCQEAEQALVRVQRELAAQGRSESISSCAAYTTVAEMYVQKYLRWREQVRGEHHRTSTRVNVQHRST